MSDCSVSRTVWFNVSEPFLRGGGRHPRTGAARDERPLAAIKYGWKWRGGASRVLRHPFWFARKHAVLAIRRWGAGMRPRHRTSARLPGVTTAGK